MSNISKFLAEGARIDHTPSGTIYAGNIINVGALSGLTPRDLGASVLGHLAVRGIIRGPHTGEGGNIGDNVWWDANGTPYGGAATGSFTLMGADGDWWVGTLARGVTANDATCDFLLNRENINLPPWLGRTRLTRATDLTLSAATHSGMVIDVLTDAHTDTNITLPTGVVGMDFLIQNNEVDTGCGTQVTLDGVEIVAGQNLTVAAGGPVTNTLGTSKRGDYLHLVCNVAAASWRCVGKRGIWA